MFRARWCRRRSWASAGAAIAVAVTCLMAATPAYPPYVVGAYYYGWYGEIHWSQLDYLGPHLAEPLEPTFGLYDSFDPAVVATHVQWAEDYGIDYLIVEWLGPGTDTDRQGRERLLPALEASTVRQAPVIETLAYLAAYGTLDVDNPTLRAALLNDIRYLGTHYLSHPTVMRIDGRPVLHIYVTRIYGGDLPAFIAEARAALAEQGLDPFIVADEVFWHEGDRERIRAFDAITPYNVYDTPITAHRGYADQSTFFRDVDALYARWSALARETGVTFIPNVMPGYNDRGVRLEENHYVIPRQARADGPITGFLERSIALARRYTDPVQRLVTVTSFNEWFEWTQVVPVRRSTRPPGTTPSVYTEGFPHPAYGFDYLEVIRDQLGGSWPPRPVAAAPRD
jgi:hypothetical protein